MGKGTQVNFTAVIYPFYFTLILAMMPSCIWSTTNPQLEWCCCFKWKWCPGCCWNPLAGSICMGSICSREALSDSKQPKKGCRRTVSTLAGTRGTFCRSWNRTRSVHLRNHVSQTTNMSQEKNIKMLNSQWPEWNVPLHWFSHNTWLCRDCSVDSIR